MERGIKLGATLIYTRRTFTPHQRIMWAARRGTGLKLNAQEVFMLSRDNAIETRATADDEDSVAAKSNPI